MTPAEELIAAGFRLETRGRCWWVTTEQRPAMGVYLSKQGARWAHRLGVLVEETYALMEAVGGGNWDGRPDDEAVKGDD